MTTLSSRLSGIQDRLAPLLHILTDPAFEARLGDPAACDFLLGNPQEMPLPGFVQALRDHLPPRNKDWYAYKMSEPEARRAVADGLRRWRGVAYDPEDILLTNGAFGGLRAVIDALAGPGDEVIFLSPPWFFYEPLILAAGAEAVRVRVDPQTYDIDLQALGRAITARTRAVIVNSPNNPTGRIYPPETLQGLASLLEEAGRRHGRPVYLISDEAYSRIIYNGKPFASPTAFYPHSFLIYTYGKTLLTPGQRIGFIALPPEMPDREAMRRALLTTQLLAGYAFPNALLQHALPDLDRLSIDVGHLRQKRDHLAGALLEQGYQLHIPEGTFYLLPRAPWTDDLTFVQLLMQHRIYCLPGAAVEMPGYFRISLTASDEMIERSLPGFAAALAHARSNPSA
ncbi:MAG: aminotransferase [Chloroflexi bacterium RBG_13_68_17]|nr:MAG: aminotransferase [Chloroflexi bacterium RBG_13_68_17]